MPLEGNLNYSELADLLKVIDLSRKTGSLNIISAEGEGHLLFEEGKLIRAESNRFSARIGDVLLEQGVINLESVSKALDIQRAEGGKRRLGAVICEDLGVGAQEVQDALNAQFKAVVFDILSWPEGRICFDVSSETLSKERFSIDATGFILDVGIEAGYLAKSGSGQDK